MSPVVIGNVVLDDDTGRIISPDSFRTLVSPAATAVVVGGRPGYATGPHASENDAAARAGGMICWISGVAVRHDARDVHIFVGVDRFPGREVRAIGLQARVKVAVQYGVADRDIPEAGGAVRGADRDPVRETADIDLPDQHGTESLIPVQVAVDVDPGAAGWPG